jgi:competence protein ComEC
MGALKASPFISRPCVPLILALIAGLLLGNLLEPPYARTLTWGLPLLLILLAGLILASPALPFPTAAFFFVITGIGLMTVLSPRVLLPQVPSFLINSRTQHLSGEIVQEPLYYPDRTRLIIRLKSCLEQGREQPVQGHILLGVKGVLKGFDQGDPVRFACRLRWIEGYHNPGGYDFESKMAFKGIRVSGFLEDPQLLMLSGPNLRSRFWHHLTVLREAVSRLIDDRMPPPANGLAQALLTGDQSKIPRPIQETFSQAGVSHLLAFSGLNLTLVGGLSFTLLRLLFSSSETLLLSVNIRKWALLGTFIPVLGYTLLAGMSPSAARALLMVATVILALLFNRYSDLLNSLALAALILLILAPEALFMPSFQLSFLAVWAIGYLLPRLFNPEAPWGRKESSFLKRGTFYLWGTFSVSLVCLLATLPVVAWWFHQVSWVGLLSNLILVPLTGILATPIGLLALGLTPLSSAAGSGLFWIMDLLIRWALSLTRFFADLPFAFGPFPRPGWGEIFFYYLFLITLFNWRRLAKPACWVGLSLSAMILFFEAPRLQSLVSPSLKLTFLDVGHGSAILVRFPQGEKMLIDGGGSFNPEFDLGERVVAPFLWQEKITALDVVVLTHPHPDHLNGLPFILSKFKVREIWLNGQSDDSESFRKFWDLIKEKKIPLLYPKTGWARTLGDTQVEVLLSPENPEIQDDFPSAGWRNRNNGSLVLRLTRGDQHILLPADIEAEAEQRLLARGIPLNSQILQVPHHGSLSSSTRPFIEAVHPRYAVISARPSAHLPLPRPEIVARYESQGVSLYRTDRDGAITFKLKPEGWEICTFRKKTMKP